MLLFANHAFIVTSFREQDPLSSKFFRSGASYDCSLPKGTSQNARDCSFVVPLNLLAVTLNKLHTLNIALGRQTRIERESLCRKGERVPKEPFAIPLLGILIKASSYPF